MVYVSTIAVPKNTPKTSPLKTRMNVTKGLVYKVEIMFPPGPSGLVHLWIMDGSYQFLPSSEGETLYGDNTLIQFDDLYIMDSEPFFFDIYTYNEDDTYDHTIQVRIGLVSKDVFMARFLPTMTYDYFEAVLERIRQEQEKTRKEKAKKLLEIFKR